MFIQLNKKKQSKLCSTRLSPKEHFEMDIFQRPLIIHVPMPLCLKSHVAYYRMSKLYLGEFCLHFDFASGLNT